MYVENTIGCQLYQYGRCKLYPEKPCIGEECLVWKLYQNKMDGGKVITEQTQKMLFLLRVICHSENSCLYSKGNSCVIEFTECEQKFCFFFSDLNDFIFEKFFDLPVIENQFPEKYDISAEEYFSLLGV